MDTLFHLVFSVIVGLAICLKRKHKISILIALASLSILVDIDHFFWFETRGTFHNIFFIFLIPLTLFAVSYIYENKKSIRLQTYSLLLFVMLTGHVITDMFYGGIVKIFYPLSTVSYSFPNYTILATSEFYSPIIAGDGLILLICSIILLSVIFIEDVIYHFEIKNESKKKALRSAFKNLV
ncbi:MAG: metal-dependent hydrolase [DPANN group archaeon]|nr:metal-dependent hydrolase [DPANN group archaeon]